MEMNDKDWALVKELRAIARMPKGHGFKRRHGDSHRKSQCFAPLSAKTRRMRGRRGW
jgi:hypothetical protein